MDTQTIFDAKKDEPNPIERLNKLQEVVKASNRILIQAKTVFPFDFFQDQIIVHEAKIDIIYGLFFSSKKITQIPIENINNVNSTHNSVFGTLLFEVVGFHEVPQPVKYLWAKDALRIRRMINGLILCKKEGIDLTELDIEIVRKKVEEIGHT